MSIKHFAIERVANVFELVQDFYLVAYRILVDVNVIKMLLLVVRFDRHGGIYGSRSTHC